MADQSKLEKYPFRQSLLKEPLLGGVSMDFLRIELFAASVIVGALGFAPGMFVCLIAVVGGLHVLGTQLSKEDPHKPTILWRHNLQRDRYPPDVHPRDDRSLVTKIIQRIIHDQPHDPPRSVPHVK